METINAGWRPSPKSSNALLAHGYSQKQLDTIGKVFVKRYWQKQLPSASTDFTAMVKSSGSGHNVKPKPNNANNALRQRKDDLVNKSKEGHKRAQEIKNSGANDEMKLACANMILSRYGSPMGGKTTFEQAKAITGLEI